MSSAQADYVPWILNLQYRGFPLLMQAAPSAKTRENCENLGSISIRAGGFLLLLGTFSYAWLLGKIEVIDVPRSLLA